MRLGALGLGFGRVRLSLRLALSIPEGSKAGKGMGKRKHGFRV